MNGTKISNGSRITAWKVILDDVLVQARGSPIRQIWFDSFGYRATSNRP
jgi:hypothetical protein